MPKVQPIDNGAGRVRAGRSRRVTTTLAEINVVPLVDVMLVLLIIFMVAAPMMQRGFDVNLPQAVRSQSMSEERLYVTVPLTFRKDRRVQINDERVMVDYLGERIRQLVLVSSRKQVFLRCDGAITVQEQMQVMDKLREGGVDKVGIVTKLPGER
jgi:biopolymer transport protein ExbD